MKGNNGLGAYNYLSKGMTGEGVREMQNDLISLGFSLKADGTFGDETYRAVKNFQYTWGSLTIDGIVGMQTATAIKEAVTMLGEGRWNPSTDPMTAPTSVYTAEIPQPPRVTATTTPTTSPTVEIPSSIPVIGGFKLDWKWIGIGALAVYGFFHFAKRKR
jgi:peptidoglycan hydrolase-like protein with peptidoglycan-binding domain